MRYVAMDSQNDVELMLMTADRHDWHVQIDLVTLGRLAGRRITSDDDARGVINTNMTTLRLAALRAIGRKGMGDDVRLDAYDLRLPRAAAIAA